MDGNLQSSLEWLQSSSVRKLIHDKPLLLNKLDPYHWTITKRALFDPVSSKFEPLTHATKIVQNWEGLPEKVQLVHETPNFQIAN